MVAKSCHLENCFIVGNYKLFIQVVENCGACMLSQSFLDIETPSSRENFGEFYVDSDSAVKFDVASTVSN